MLAQFAVPPSSPAIVREVEEAVCRLILKDDLLLDIPICDDEDPTRFNSSWKTRAYSLLDATRPDLKLPFVRWYVNAEAQASREGRSVQIPQRFTTLYPALVHGPDGQVEIYQR